jgi:hypothetical protein
MTDEHEQRVVPDDLPMADDRAAAAEAAAVEQDDNLVNEAAANAEVETPATAPIDQPNPIPPDGIQ